MGDQKWIRGEIRTTSTATTTVVNTTRASRRKQYFKTITDISLTTGIIINLIILVSIFGK
jgi:hypothetical protein